MSSKHFGDTDYSDLEEFEENRKRNDEIINGYYFPKFHACGMLLTRCNLDALPLDMSGEKDWLCQRSPEKVRFPDLYCMVKGMSVARSQAEGLAFSRDIFAEIKDFPRMSRWPVTGFTLYCWQTYVAAQQYADKPTAVFFRDTAERAKGTDAMPGFDLLYGTEPYGALLNDLVMSPVHPWGQSFMPEPDKSERRWQIRFRTEAWNRSAQDRPEPCMWALKDFAALLRSGEVRRVALRDPGEWKTWKVAQEWAARLNLPPIRVPERGLICYTSNPAFPGEDPRFPL